MNSKFIHLHCHSEYSLLDGTFSTKELVAKCKAQNMTSVALTDNGVMYGSIDFYVTAKAEGLTPIVGCEMFLVQDITKKERGLDRLILLCQNYEGYQNLIKLVTIANLDGFYYKPRIDLANLAQFNKGLFAISPGQSGPIAYRIQKNKNEEAEKLALNLKAIYQEKFYLGVQRLKESFEDTIIEETLNISKAHQIPIVVTNNVYYLEKEHAPLRQILNCIQTGKKVAEDFRALRQSEEMYFKSAEEMEVLFADIPEAVSNSMFIAQNCDLKIDTERVTLPNFNCPDNKTSEEYLEELVWQGIEKKYKKVTEAIKERAKFELSIIQKMQYPIYFLIIYDFLAECRKKDITIGPGRGSAAGSIVAYALDITKIDPLKYNLLFERFLNPDRISMPDIDIDFCIKRRGEVIEYILQKYGKEHVSQIVTFGTMAARGVIRDVGRVLGIDLKDVDKIAKLIPSTPGTYTSIPEAIDLIPELKKLYNGGEEIKKLLDLGIKLEGLTRHTSTHAAGVVISRDPLNSVVPLVKNEGQIVTQYQMGDLEKLGLLKMDILGLRNLTVVAEALTRIKKYQNIEIDLDHLPVEDKATYEMLCTGETSGVFQLESRGMRELIKKLKPTVFEDLIALLALYRPGPLGSGMVNDFISNKSGETEVHYEIPELEAILKDTYGMILYQEQVMQIASAVGGFSLSQADMMRRAMGKKKKDVMNKLKAEFLTGAQLKNIPLKKAEKIFELCYKFAEYGFNKSHSAAYALISFQTAYLKTHYPKEYMSALLSSILGSTDRISIYVQACQEMNIKIFAPSINESEYDFTINEQGIRFGLGAIKNVGEAAIQNIIESRKEAPYKDLMDFCQRVDLRQVNKRVLESLIKSGAFDDFGKRPDLLTIYERVAENAQISAKEKSNGQIGLFSAESTIMHQDNLNTTEKLRYSKNELLKMEKDLIGLYLSGHPLDAIKSEFLNMQYNCLNLKPEDDGKIVVLKGILSDCRRIINKNQKEMVSATLEDLTGEIRALLFQNKKFEEYAKHFVDDDIVRIKGKVRSSQDEVTLICDEISSINITDSKECNLDLDIFIDDAVFEKVKTVCKKYPGRMPIFINCGDATIEVNKKYWIENSPECLADLKSLIGAGNVWVV